MSVLTYRCPNTFQLCQSTCFSGTMLSPRVGACTNDEIHSSRRFHDHSATGRRCRTRHRNRTDCAGVGRRSLLVSIMNSSANHDSKGVGYRPGVKIQWISVRPTRSQDRCPGRRWCPCCGSRRGGAVQGTAADNRVPARKPVAQNPSKHQHGCGTFGRPAWSKRHERTS